MRGRCYFFPHRLDPPFYDCDEERISVSGNNWLILVKDDEDFIYWSTRISWKRVDSSS